MTITSVNPKISPEENQWELMPEIDISVSQPNLLEKTFAFFKIRD